MANTPLNRSSDLQPAATSLFDGSAFPANTFNEAFSAPGVPRSHWQLLVDSLNTAGVNGLRRRQERVTRMRHEDGATFNLFKDFNERAAAWELDVIPMPLPAGEWAVLENGLIQRARLLEKILADIYGAQNLIPTGQIPAEMIFDNPNFLRPSHGIQPNGNRFLGFYAADIYRGADGRFRVYRDYGASPAGLGYALENRVVISRMFAKFYQRNQIRRLAPFFQAFHQNLIRRASLQKEDPGIVLLSPGPESRFYFEHAFLSRYLNYPLVEGQDLTVRDGEVFLKKLTGLEPVGAIFRHIKDQNSDPFALRNQTATGVAGLMQVARDQTIDIVNPIGSGFVDTPALPTLLPELCRQIMGENLLLENHPRWWCQSAESRNHVLANLTRLTFGPAMDRSAAINHLGDMRRAIEESPHRFVAQEPLYPATVPTWGQQGVRNCPAMMRVFVCATEQGFCVMPGGLGLFADDPAVLAEGSLDRQQSKDIWVFSDQPVEPVSLMKDVRTISEFRRSNDLPSRIADHLLWLGRYLERAEARVRLLRSVFRRLSGEDHLSDIPEMSFLLKLLRAENIIPPATASVDGNLRFQELSDHLFKALYPQVRMESIATVLEQVQGAARHVRDWFSIETWRVINRLEVLDEDALDDPLDFLDDTLLALSAFSGLAQESITRGLGWRFMDMGRRIERALNLTNLLRVGISQSGRERRSDLEAILEVAASIMTYRSRYRKTFQLPQVLDLLLLDETNPKSLAFQCSRLSSHVENLPRQTDRRFASPEERLALEMLTSVRLLDLTRLGVMKSDAQNQTLMAFLESMAGRLKDFSQEISAQYLSRVPTTPHFSVISGDTRR